MPFPADPITSPFTYEATDFEQRVISLVVDFNDSTRALIGGVCHRDPGCLYSHIVWDNPSGANRKPLPAVPDGDTSFTAQQIRSATGFRTIEDLLAVQITAEP